MRKKSVMMRVDLEFHEICSSMGMGTQATRKLAKERSILSEMISNDDFIKKIEEIYKEL